MNKLYETIAELCAQKGIKPGKMCNDLGISRGNITDLKAGRIEKLSVDNLKKIAVYFNVSVDYLIGAETKKALTDDGEGEDLAAYLQLLRERPETRALLDASKNMTKSQVEKYAAFIADIREE